MSSLIIMCLLQVLNAEIKTCNIPIRDVPDIRFRFLLAGYPAIFFYPVPVEMVPGTGYLYRIVKLFEMDGTL